MRQRELETRELQEKYRPIVDPTVDKLDKLGRQELEIYCTDLLQKYKAANRKEMENMQTIGKFDEIKRETGVTDLHQIKEETKKYLFF